MYIGVASLGILAAISCVLWSALLRSHLKITQAKYAVIGKIEDELCCQLFRDEDVELKERGYRPLTSIEQCLPIVVACCWVLLVILQIGNSMLSTS
jgi:hypothetical protein